MRKHDGYKSVFGRFNTLISNRNNINQKRNKMKCSKNQKKINGVCVGKTTRKLFGNLSDEVSIIRLALISVFVSASGWAIFTGIVKLLNLETLNGIWLISIGLLSTILIYKFGLENIKT